MKILKDGYKLKKAFLYECLERKMICNHVWSQELNGIVNDVATYFNTHYPYISDTHSGFKQHVVETIYDIFEEEDNLEDGISKLKKLIEE